ncbi:hypothetical protein [Verrucomicrobium spinosum]|uniref:hypothetical protein n=1 Tax=Verrucomicrobium spinosum TaxID=2736 RepID=UPI00155DBD48|nr:hypothetical protein [Verrucomicrobium spinosum]
MGFDIAASGHGDLGSFYVDGKEGDVFKLRGLLTTQTEDWHFMKCACRWFLTNLSAIMGCGDETGLGRNICWDMKQEFPTKFRGVNFSTLKVTMGMRLMDQLSAHQKIIPLVRRTNTKILQATTTRFRRCTRRQGGVHRDGQ